MYVCMYIVKVEVSQKKTVLYYQLITMVRTVATRSWSKVKIVIVEDQRSVKQWTSAVWPEMTSLEHQDVQ